MREAWVWVWGWVMGTAGECPWCVPRKGLLFRYKPRIGAGPRKLERSSDSWTIGVRTAGVKSRPFPGHSRRSCDNAAMASVSQPPRLYRGISPAERRAQRRERLFDAGVEQFGNQGYAQSSIRSVCAEASLNSRYFYESFT